MKSLSAKVFKEFLRNSYNLFSLKVDYINELNLFPIPDKDTGINMFLTITNGINKIENNEYDSVTKLLGDFSKGLLIGARGNSGVIFSQIMTGFYRYFKDKYKETKLESASINDILAALISANQYAKKSVLKPIQGTILTVINDVAKNSQGKHSDITHLFNKIENVAKKSIDSTPKLLKISNSNNSIDAGAMGLYIFLKGFSDYLNNVIHHSIQTQPMPSVDSNLVDHSKIIINEDFKEIGYCTEGIICLPVDVPFNKSDISQELKKMGCESLVLVHDESIFKFHLHTNFPWDALKYLRQFGPFYKLKIENMTFQTENHTIVDNSNEASKSNDEILKTKLPPRDKGIIIIGSGGNIHEIFKDFNLDYIHVKENNIVPSVKEIISIFEHINAKDIFIFSNDNSALMAIQNAKKMFKGPHVHIIETKNIFECYACLIYFDKNNSPSNIIKECKDSLSKINYRIICPNTENNNKTQELSIQKGDYMSLFNNKVDFSHANILDVVANSVTKLIEEGTPEIFTCFLGKHMNKENEESIRKYFANNINYEVEFFDLQQPFHDLIIGVEYKK